MTWSTRIKLGLMVAAGILWFGAMRTGRDWLRLVAIGLLAVALLLRFVYPGRPRG